MRRCIARRGLGACRRRGDQRAAPAAAPRALDRAALAPSAPATRRRRTLDGRMQDAKADVIKLNRDLLVLEEELLFPANTQVAVFVSMDVGMMFELDSVQIKLDDKVVSNYLYTPLEVAGAASRRRAARLPRQPEDRRSTRSSPSSPARARTTATTSAARRQVRKGTEPKYIELQIKDSTGKLQPEFDVKIWQ